jgi:choline transport protein
MITNVGAFVGSDAPAQMAEELKDSSRLLPQVMFGTIMVNGAMGFFALM